MTVHVKGEDGAWGSAGSILNPEPDWWAGGHGLYSTPQDYIRFERALLRGGELDGVRILRAGDRRRGVQQPDRRPRLPRRDPHRRPADHRLVPRRARLEVGPRPAAQHRRTCPARRRAGTGAWAGLFNTHFFIDRTTGVCASIYTNSLPFVTPEAMGVYGDFEEALYAAL